MSNSKTIAKNTLFLYFRMFLIMGVTLYTSRVVLQQLGVSDYGIYSLVGGVVTMLGFFNAAMSSATQRYLSFDIGKGDDVKLQKTFSATLTIHFFIAIFVLVLAETLGLWYVNYKMVFPEDRLYAVNMVYQFSVLTFLFNIVQVPYNALIIARERMQVYAYVSVLEAILKLGIVFFLVFGNDKLILYSILTFVVAFIIRLIYQIYCKNQFKESEYRYEYDKEYYKELLAYSGWNLFGNFAAVARGQGVNMVLNLFFGTVVNAAYGMAMQVQGAVQLFVNNFQMAVNPQIIKTYASGDFYKMKNLVFQSSKFSFFLLLFLLVPLLLHTDFLLITWLGEVPKTTALFVKLMLLSILIDSISGSLMIAVQATGKVKWYQIILGTLIFMNLPISYFVLKIGGEGYYVFLVLILITLLTLIFRMFFLKSILNFEILDFLRSVVLRVFYVSIIIILICVLLNDVIYDLNNGMTIIRFGNCLFIEVLFLVFIILLIGTNKKEKRFIGNLVIVYKKKWIK
ncbi:oligosaccharide flippase family protein [Myroides odoratimimus]|uniref:oligosaccharide flippase family protein n=1 Tax=Myroides odoratimimus TaxID=76832 RepID=UPI00257881A3|nr:oligosaccharide flippase family protein [Myroides odoratimimus]MDM1094744.1 oligosaccharide flippase family protein [Myroides odoratimimus]